MIFEGEFFILVDRDGLFCSMDDENVYWVNEFEPDCLEFSPITLKLLQKDRPGSVVKKVKVVVSEENKQGD